VQRRLLATCFAISVFALAPVGVGSTRATVLAAAAGGSFGQSQALDEYLTVRRS
jgi:hypothetical protein